MTILTILGSPRKKGNTAAVLKEFEASAQPFAEIQRINIADLNISGCRGCDACKRISDKPGCILKDDVNDILNRMISADMIIYAAPVYVWDFTAQMKTLMDRHYSLVKDVFFEKPVYLLEDKPTVLLTTCGGDEENNADLLRLIFRREMAYLHSRIAGEYVLPFCTKPSELGDRAGFTAREMIRALFPSEVSENKSV